MKKFVLAAAAAGLGALALTSCNGGNDTVKVGFIIAGSTGEEMKSFQANWEEYAKENNVELFYESFKGQDPAYYKTCAENLIAKNCDAIICNFEMSGKENVASLCEKEKVYYAYSGSSLDKETFAEFADSEYFVGQIAPTPEEEEKQTYEMTKYFIETYYDGKDDLAFPEGTSGKFGVWPVDFHGITLEHQMTYRYKGMKKALAEYGVTINGDNDFDSSKWSATYSANCPEKLKNNIIFLGNNMADMNALIAQCSQQFAQRPSTVITTCNGHMLMNMFASQGAEFGVLSQPTRFGTVEGFTSDYDVWYKADANAKVPAFKVAHDPYLVGKYSAINTPILDMVVRAVRGEALRDNGKAFNINQHYLVAKNKSEFDKAKAASTSFKYTLEDLNKIKTVADLQKLFDDATLENLSK